MISKDIAKFKTVPVVTGAVSHTYATFNPAQKGSALTLGSGNLSFTSSGVGSVLATIPVTIGSKRYWEIKAGSAGTNMVIGIDSGAALPSSLSGYTGSTAASYGLYGGGSGIFYNGGIIGTGTFAAYTNGDIIGVALDLVAFTVQFYKNGLADGAACPVAHSSYYPACGSGAAAVVDSANFGQSAFSYSVPTGFTGGVF